MGDVEFFGSVGNILALCDFNLEISGLPVVGNKEDSVRATYSLKDRRLRVQIGLSRIGINCMARQ